MQTTCMHGTSCMGSHLKVLILVQVIPRNIRGAVIGYGLLCDRVNGSRIGNSEITLAVEVNYGLPGFALSLARVFQKVYGTAEHTLIMYYTCHSRTTDPINFNACVWNWQ